MIVSLRIVWNTWMLCTVTMQISWLVRCVVDCVWNVMARAETRFRLSAKWTSPFKSAGASVQSNTGNRGVRISGSNAGYTMFRGSVKCTGYPFRSPVSRSLPLPCVTLCHHISTGLYHRKKKTKGVKVWRWNVLCHSCVCGFCVIGHIQGLLQETVCHWHKGLGATAASEPFEDQDSWAWCTYESDLCSLPNGLSADQHKRNPPEQWKILQRKCRT
jgi:hypothetical protein